MSRFLRLAPGCLRVCALLLTLLCARAHAQAQPGAVTVVGTFQSELGCPGDWDAACANTHLERDPVDGVWRRLFTVPGGPQEFKVTLNDSWEENYGANAQRDGANLAFSHTEAELAVKFFYDPVSHWVTNSSLTPIAVLAGSLQTELGCPSDWAPACMLTWLKDIDGDGVQELIIPSLPAGTYELKVAHHESWAENYGADGVFDGANISFTVPAPGQPIRFRYETWSHRLAIQVAAPTITTLGVSANPVHVDEPVTLTATVAVTGSTAFAAGTVTFKADGAELGTAPVGPDGTATLTLATGIGRGTVSLTAEYGGTYEPSVSVPVVLHVRYGSVTTLTVTPSGTSPHGYGVFLRAEVRAENANRDGFPDGEVTWLNGDTVLGTSRLDEHRNASLTTGALPVGELRLSAVFSPEAPFRPSRDEVVHTVTRAHVDVLFGVDDHEVPLGMPMTFRAQVRRSGFPGVTATGTVDFVVVSEGPRQVLGTAPLDAQGETSVVVTGLPIGTYDVRADYSGDASYLPQQSLPSWQTVTVAESRMVVTASPTTSVYGQPVDIRVEVRPVAASVEQTPAGEFRLEFRNEVEVPAGSAQGQLDAEGRANTSTLRLPPGRFWVSGTYEGGPVFGPSTSAEVAFTVLRGPSQVALASSRNPSDSGEAVTLTAQVSAASPATGTPEGSVTFLDGTTPLSTVPIDSQGVATYTTSALAAGERGLTVAYSGNTRFEPGTSVTLAQIVRPAGTPDAGSGEADAGSGNSDAGSGDTDAGTSTGDAGSTPGDAGTQAPDAGAGNPDAGTTAPLPSEGDEGSGCGCGAGSGGSPLLLLGMWMGLTALQSRRRSRGSTRG
ncbi:Ig-like domain repeat protein [Pyxidicoccus trucidator]|uniref:Ig-like domain repeat protein n=1 Tax=Pyxidicoccus trucidator TaxID=2709662 RepID=UPI0013DC74A1|nr:Ig-like domain repeat protein [Pyxidicoccus trucidator]